MKFSTLEALCCPVCHSDYDVRSFEKSDGSIRYGFLICSTCNSAVPICAGFALFTETHPFDEEQSTHEFLQNMENNLFGDSKRYESFIKEKSRRKSHDAYAVFQPFNESSQAFLPFVPLLRQILKSGDRILDTWCRTGWSAGFLSGIFSNQNIISIWEGNSDTLGYHGFRYWFSQLPEENNIDIMFHSMNQPLPFKSESITAVHALDTLHRYEQKVFIPELLRITKQDGVVIFPHVHLSNSQPDPYFDRGGTILHGRDYKEHFEKLLDGSGRKVFILSEPETFMIDEPKSLLDNSETSDYNGLVAVVPGKFEGFHLHRETIDPERIGCAYVFVNPIHTINLSTATVIFDGNKLSGSVGKLFHRHPIYEKKLRSSVRETLSAEECEVIYWAKKAMTVGAIAQKMNRSVAELMPIIRPLEISEVIQVREVYEAIARLQYFHSDQVFLHPDGRQTIKNLFENSVREFADRPLIISDDDDSTFRYRDAAEIVDAIVKKLSQSGLVKGDRIVVYSAVHPEAIFLFWAAMQMGLVFVPVDYHTPQTLLKNIVERVEPRLIFCDHERMHAVVGITDIASILFDGDIPEDAPIQIVFSNWVNDISGEPVSLPDTASDDTAVILFTSGTTGNSKGVLLTQGALYRSGSQIAEAFEWGSRDVLLSVGELHAMSGLRNPCVATLFAGASMVVSSSKVRGNVTTLAQCIQKHQCTILSTIPTAIRQLDQFRDRIGRETLSTLRCVMCTGSNLSESLMQSFENFYSIPVLDYYGLTETCGFCIGVSLQGREAAKSTLGVCVGCMAQVVDENDQILGFDRVGELRLYSDNLMEGYYNEKELTNSVLKNGWFYTGDLVKIRSDNHIIMTGRKKDIIKDKFGNVVYPAEVEQCLAGHSGVTDVVVVGFRHSNEEEKLAAFIVPGNGSMPHESLIEELRNHIRDKIGSHKIPQIIEFKDQLPRNSNGKPEKKLLIDELNLKKRF